MRSPGCTSTPAPSDGCSTPRRSAGTLDARLIALLKRHVAAIDYAGAALVWRPDAIVVQAVETLDASRVDAWLRHWACDNRPVPPELRRVPATAMAMASARLDLSSLRELAYRVIPEADHPRLANLEAVLSGLLLGQDLASRILPALGPGAMAYVESPGDPAAEGGASNGASAARGRLFPVVLVVDISGGRPADARRAGRSASSPSPSAPDALDNALKTLLALLAMDEKRVPGGSTIARVDAGGTPVSTLRPPIPFAYAVNRAGGRLVLGTSAPSVARYLEAAADPRAGAVPRLPGRRVPGIRHVRLHRPRRRDPARRQVPRPRGRHGRRARHRPAAEVQDDLEQVLALGASSAPPSSPAGSNPTPPPSTARSD